jgi:membrane protein YqaA with SNARE-associated domain
MAPSETSLAERRFRELERWRILWTALVFAVGLATTIVVITAIFQLITTSWLPAAIATLGSVVGGVAVRWLVTRRQEAAREAQDAFQDLEAAAARDREIERGKTSRKVLHNAVHGEKESEPE